MQRDFGIRYKKAPTSNDGTAKSLSVFSVRSSRSPNNVEIPVKKTPDYAIIRL